MIDFIFEEITPIKIKEGEIAAWVGQIIATENKVAGDLCFILTSDQFLLNLNQKYLSHDYYTDVITFDYSDGDFISGDIFISIDRIKDNAKQFKVSFDYELSRIVIHGVLHLLGYNDKTNSDKKIMTDKEDECLKIFWNVKGV